MQFAPVDNPIQFQKEIKMNIVVATLLQKEVGIVAQAISIATEDGLGHQKASEECLSDYNQVSESNLNFWDIEEYGNFEMDVQVHSL